MPKLNEYLKILFLLGLSIWPPAKATAEPKGLTLKVGGDYEVTAIDQLNESEFRVEFRAVTPTGKFDTLNLHSNHVHVAVRIGQKLRLSAEILTDNGRSAEVAQMVIFISNPQGPIPVWLLSNRAGHQDLRATKYIDMHSPLTDYIVL